MSIPIDRLYHYIQQISEEISEDRVIIYRFWPHGSKNINDLKPLSSTTWTETMITPTIYCHDQEPLHYDLYAGKADLVNNSFNNFLRSSNLYVMPSNFILNKTIFEKSILIHSEKRSSNLQTYIEDNTIPVYYWSHALISLDWFRYAEHITQNKQVNKTFLIYNRAWSGTREYRLKFSELLIRLGLPGNCQTSINPVEPELDIHYDSHTFKNPTWRPVTVLENFFPISDAHSHYSADFSIEDYNATDIEVVLETLFDDERLHLTEKSLRPIACGQPFILAGTHGSLEYLRGYGFKTFGHIWDERYNLIEDPEERLIRIADLMKQISNWTPKVREQKMSQAQAIADYNKQHFFSKEFFNLVVGELKTNLTSAIDELRSCNNYVDWIARWNNLLSRQEVIKYLDENKDPVSPTKLQAEYVIKITQDKLNKTT